jgi:site-specific DNA-methyltransferase (adenine-specific)
MATQTVIQGDCRTIMREMPPGSVKVIIFSPPYNLGKDYGASYDDDRALEEYLQEQCEVARAIARVLDPQGHLFLNVGWNSGCPMRGIEVMLEYAKHLRLQNTFFWIKSIAPDGRGLPEHLRDAMHERQMGHLLPSTSRYFATQTVEYVWHFSPEGRSPIDVDAPGVGVGYVYPDQPARFGHNRKLHCRGLAVHIPYKTIQSRSDRDYHPSPFPVDLPLYFLRLAACQPSDLVLDPFMGTGATLVAAQQLGLDAIGVDLNPDYCQAARRRLNQPEEGIRNAAD